MGQAGVLQEIRQTRFEEAHRRWQKGRLTQEEAAFVFGVCSRTFHGYDCRYEEKGIEGLLDKRITRALARRTPADEVLVIARQYSSTYRGGK